jgi:hypothetical protein
MELEYSWVVKIHFFLKKKSSHWCPRTGQVFQMEPRRKIGTVHGGVHGGFSGKNMRMSMLGYFWTYISFILSTYYQTSLIKLIYKPS